MTSTSDSEKRDDDTSDRSSNWLEWLVGTAGAIIVAGTLGYLVVEIFSGAADPPDLHVTLGTPIDQGNEMIIPVTVENKGGSVAADAFIEICVDPQTCAQLTFDFVPHESKRHGNVGFSKPMTGSLTTRVMSYQEP